MLDARQQGNVTVMGHPVQIFVDISQSTIQKRRALKPLLSHLINHHIKYHWSFPFKLAFLYKGRSYSFNSFQSGEALLQELGLISTYPQTSFNVSETGDRPVSPLWSQQGRSRARRPPLNTCISAATVSFFLSSLQVSRTGPSWFGPRPGAERLLEGAILL